MKENACKHAIATLSFAYSQRNYLKEVISFLGLFLLTITIRGMSRGRTNAALAILL